MTKLYLDNVKLFLIIFLNINFKFSLKCCDDCIDSFCDCCERCFKNNNEDNENNEEEIINNEDNKENIKEVPKLPIQKKYNLINAINLNNINLEQDLENIFIQLLSERLYNYMTDCAFDKIRVYNTEEDKNKEQTMKFNLNGPKDEFILLQVKKILNEKKKKEFFKDITLLNLDKFNNINDDYVKLLATFFLSDEDYKNYINEKVDAFKKDQEKEDNIFNKDIFENLKKDNKFLELLGDHEGTPIVLNEVDAKKLSKNLKKCPPYVGETFRGTGIYDKKTGDRIDINEKWDDSQQIIINFIDKIKNCTWEEPRVKPYTSDPYIAGHFAMGYGKRNEKFTKFKIFIHNHNNKTGVELEKFYDKNREQEEGYPLAGFFVIEKEILCPINSKFKILGIQLGVKETYCRDKQIKYYQPFLVLDVIQIE